MTEKRFEVVLNEFDEVEYIMDKEMMEDRDFAEFIDFVEDVCTENEQLKQANERICDDIDLALGFIRHKGYSLQDIKDYGDAKKEYEENLKEFRKGDVE